MRCPEPGKLCFSLSTDQVNPPQGLVSAPCNPSLLQTGQLTTATSSSQKGITLPAPDCGVASFTVKLFPFPVKPDKSCHMQFLCIMEMFCWCFKFSFHRCDPAMDCESAMQQLRHSHGWSRREAQRGSTEGKEQSWPLLLLVLLPLKDPVVLLLSFSLSWFSKSMFRDLQGTKQRWQMSSQLLLRLISCSVTATAQHPAPGKALQCWLLETTPHTVGN